MSSFEIVRVVLLAASVSAGCITAPVPKPGPAAAQRAPDSPGERIAASQEASGIGQPEATEQRFGTEEARARREAQRRPPAVVNPKTNLKADK